MWHYHDIHSAQNDQYPPSRKNVRVTPITTKTIFYSFVNLDYCSPEWLECSSAHSSPTTWSSPYSLCYFPLPGGLTSQIVSWGNGLSLTLFFKSLWCTTLAAKTIITKSPHTVSAHLLRCLASGPNNLNGLISGNCIIICSSWPSNPLYVYVSLHTLSRTKLSMCYVRHLWKEFKWAEKEITGKPHHIYNSLVLHAVSLTQMVGITLTNTIWLEKE